MGQEQISVNERHRQDCREWNESLFRNGATVNKYVSFNDTPIQKYGSLYDTQN